VAARPNGTPRHRNPGRRLEEIVRAARIAKGEAVDAAR
jgi:hypothetical protein